MHRRYYSKRFTTYFLIISVLLSSFLYGVNNNSYSDAKTKTIKKTIKLYKGQSYRLKLKKYKYKSSKKKIVSVTQKGKIKAKKTGKARITATSFDRKKKYIYTVKVGNYIASLSIDNAITIVLKTGSTTTLKTTISPSGVLYKNLTFTSENANIAKVDKNGVITAVSQGNTVIKATSKAITRKKKNITASVTIVVIGEAKTPSPDEKGDIIDDLGDYDVLVPINTDEPTATPTVEPTKEPTAEPTSEPTSDPTSSPTVTQTPTITPTETPTPTATPTQSPSPTPVVTEKPMTPKEYVDSLTVDPNNPVVGKFLLQSNNNTYRTVYLINKDYVGKVRLFVKDFVYSSEIDTLSLLRRVEIETGSITNSAGTVTATKYAKKGKWTVEFLQTGEKYYIQGSVVDAAYNSPYGLIVADGNTLDIINIIPE